MAEIKRRSKTIEVYAVGGKEFSSEKAAQDYLDLLSEKTNYVFYVIFYNFDYCEGRFYQSREIVAIKKNEYGGFAKNAITAYCLSAHGNPIGDFYGSPQDNWRISEPHDFSEAEDVEQWLHENNADKAVIYCDESGQVEQGREKR